MKHKLLIIAIISIIGFSFITCNNSDNGNESDDSDAGSGSNERWRFSKSKTYTVKNGVASLSSETVRNWIIYSYTSDTNYENKYTNTQTTYGSTTTSSSGTYHITRNGQTSVTEQTTNSGNTTETSNSTTTYNYAGKQLTSETTRKTTTTAGTTTQTSSSTITYDSASGLISKYTANQMTNSSGTTTNSSYEISYTIQLLSDSVEVKTYRQSYSKYISNGVSQDISTQGYTEYKVQNGKTLEAKSFSAIGVLQSITTYDNNGNIKEQKNYTDGVLSYTFTLSDNAVISAKIGLYWTLSRNDYPSTPANNSYQTAEILSDSATNLVIRDKTFTNNVLSGQTDYTYEKVKL